MLTTVLLQIAKTGRNSWSRLGKVAGSCRGAAQRFMAVAEVFAAGRGKGGLAERESGKAADLVEVPAGTEGDAGM